MNSSGSPSLLSGRGITKHFGRLVANDRVDFDVRAGEIHALIGENGAGKSTLMNILYGMLQPDAGTILLHGEATTFRNCADAIQAGIGMVFQHYLLVERFSVADNVLLGRESSKAGMLDRRAARSLVADIAERYHFNLDPGAAVETLGIGARQQVELLKVLERNPQVVILDEPTAALSPLEMQALFDVMRRMRSEGRAVVFITHKLKEVMAISDRITVLRRGRVVATLDQTEANESLLGSMMIGKSVVPQAKSGGPTTHDRAQSRKEILTMRDITIHADHGGQPIVGLSMSIQAGEIIGIAGVEGNGQLEFAEALYGLRETDSGSIILGDIDITNFSSVQRRAAGLRYIPADRQREGLVLEFDATENALLGSQRLTNHPVIDRQDICRQADTIANNYEVNGYQRYKPVREYSGGNQQKFVVGREMGDRAKLVIAFAPTRGVDIGVAEIIYDRLRALAQLGAGVILISYDLDEIRALASRIFVFFKGKIAGEIPVAEADDARLGQLMGGVPSHQ